jgi:hypothetical protein
MGQSSMGHNAHPKGTASETLDRIRRGGTHLILAAQRSLGETRALLDDGDFQGAMKAAARLHEKINALAVAEGSLATVSDARILKCSRAVITVDRRFQTPALTKASQVAGSPLVRGASRE